MVDWQDDGMEIGPLKRIEIDGFPALDEHVWVDCGGYRCLGKRVRNGKWINPHTGAEIERVISYFVLTAPHPATGDPQQKEEVMA